MTILLNFETPAPIKRVMHATMRGPQRQYALQYALRYAYRELCMLQ